MLSAVLKVVACIVAPLALFIAWMQWETHKVASFCGAVHAGTPLASLKQLADDYGVDGHWINKSIVDERTKDRVFFVPVAATIGEVACAVHHDGVVAKSSHMVGA